MVFVVVVVITKTTTKDPTERLDSSRNVRLEDYTGGGY